VALVLAGCGARDGAEITEAVSAMIAFSQAGYSLSLFAPNRDAHHLVNHLNGQDVVGMRRNMLEEANRIGRGHVRAISELHAVEFDALVFSGGFGVAKNLCDYAFRGSAASIFPDVKACLLSFLDSQKPIAAMCIAPVLLGMLARDRGLKNVRLTTGNGAHKDTIESLHNWGCAQVNCNSGEACIDEVHRFVSVPAYMISDASPADVYLCAQAMAAGLRKLFA
jgi:enhancing lycopene biosynthesis protein 2